MNKESTEFIQWWNRQCDPDETGRARMMASHAFEAGREAVRTNVRVNLLLWIFVPAAFVLIRIMMLSAE